MAFARNIPKKDTENNEKYLSKSAWTPMANGSSNLKVFEERKTLISHWFDKWTDAQRRQILSILITKCKGPQLQYVQSIVKNMVPITSCDFTVLLPRKISVKIFSYLDPRSLCRVANTCWRWKDISELDIIWKQKCLRFGWDLLDSGDSIQHTRGKWKEHYINKVQQMNYVAATKTSEPLTTGTLDQGPPPSQIKKKRSVKLRKKINQTETLQKSDRNLTDSDNKDNKFPPWRGPDPKPTDSHRKFKIGEKVQRKPVPLMLRSVTAFKSSVKESRKENENINKSKANPTREKQNNTKLAKTSINQSNMNRASTPGDSFFSKQAWEVVDSDSN